MVDEGSSQMGFQQHSDVVILNSPSSGTTTRSMPMHPVYGSDWDSMNSLRPTGDFGGSIISQRELTKSSSFPLLLETQGISSSPHLAIYPTNPNIFQMLPKLQMYGSGNYHEMVNTFGLPGASQNPHAIFPQNHVWSRTLIDDKRPLDAAQAERSCQMSEGRTVAVSPNSKRKRDSEPTSPANKSSEGEPLKDHSSETSCRKELVDDKRQDTAGNSSDKQAGKQVKDNTEGEEASKQNYIHVRARRGQATNSHSLAERVRREKISERMRLLQELVPGCNKITGKAVMLDEIINYVQSLQQQVEFLSMKLATVNPELNFDIERLLSKDINNSRGSGPLILGFDQGMSSSNAFTQDIHQALNTMPNAASPYHHMSQAVWDGDLQSLLQMGFDSNSALGGLGPNGNSKSEL